MDNKGLKGMNEWVLTRDELGFLSDRPGRWTIVPFVSPSEPIFHLNKNHSVSKPSGLMQIENTGSVKLCQVLLILSNVSIKATAIEYFSI